MNNDWLDYIIDRTNLGSEGDYEDIDITKKSILNYIAENFVTKQECEKRVLEAKKEGARFVRADAQQRILKNTKFSDKQMNIIFNEIEDASMLYCNNINWGEDGSKELSE